MKTDWDNIFNYNNSVQLYKMNNNINKPNLILVSHSDVIPHILIRIREGKDAAMEERLPPPPNAQTIEIGWDEIEKYFDNI